MYSILIDAKDSYILDALAALGSDEVPSNEMKRALERADEVIHQQVDGCYPSIVGYGKILQIPTNQQEKVTPPLPGLK